MLSGSFSELFSEDLHSVARALLAVGAVCYVAKQAVASPFLNRDEVQYAIEAHLPQGFDRSIISSRYEQRLTKSIMVKSLRIDVVKQQLRTAVDREGKLQSLNELFPLTLAGILGAAHVHSLTVSLFAVKNMALVLIHLLRKLEAKKNSRGGVVIGKLRSWWAGGTQNLLMEALMNELGAHKGGDSPFTALFDEENPTVSPEFDHGFSVEALLRVVTPRVVETAHRAVREVLARHPPHAFGATGITTGRALRALLTELCDALETGVVWSDWLRPCAWRERPPHAQLRRQSSSESSDGVLEFPAGSTAVVPDGDAKWRRQQRDVEVFESVFGPPRGEDAAVRSAKEEELRREELAREQAAGFFHAIIHSPSFHAMCIAYAREVLEAVGNEASDLHSLRSYDAGTDSAKMMVVITAMETHRLGVFDRDFDVRPYMRIFCEETVRATCRQV